MQTLENNVFSLKALDGGLADLEIRIRLSADVEPGASPHSTMDMLQRLLRSAGCGIPLRVERIPQMNCCWKRR